MIQEIWKSIPGFPDYEVSDLGRVKSLKRYPNRLLSPVRTTKGYQSVGLAVNGKLYTRLVHRLVMLAFVGPCPEGLEVCHYDCDRINNHLTNLRYDSPSGNYQDSRRMGTNRRIGQPRLTPEQARQARYERFSGIPTMELAQKYGMNRPAMDKLLRGKNYAYAGGPIKCIDY